VSAPAPKSEAGGIDRAVDPAPATGSRTLVPAAFFERDPVTVAPLILNAILVGPAGAGRIVEVEAYDGAFDPASHAFRGPTPRTRTMFGPGGHLYVYRSYGMHWCANVSCRGTGVAAAVLIRALKPLGPLEPLRANRPGVGDRDLTNGPGKLCAALAITNAHEGVALFDPASEVRLYRDDVAPPRAPVQTRRVGISKAVDEPWRWYVADDPNVSRPRAVPAAP
jgi:DNA-3-methyladenine glycosylase